MDERIITGQCVFIVREREVSHGTLVELRRNNEWVHAVVRYADGNVVSVDVESLRPCPHAEAKP